MKIKKSMKIGEVLREKPEAARILFGAGLGCVGCPMAQMESLEDGMRAHGLSDEEIDEVVKEINELR